MINSTSGFWRLGSVIYAFLGAVFLLGPYSIVPLEGRVLYPTGPATTAVIVLCFVLDTMSFILAGRMFIVSIVNAFGAVLSKTSRRAPHFRRVCSL